jgi:hypothetical protein
MDVQVKRLSGPLMRRSSLAATYVMPRLNFAM